MTITPEQKEPEKKGPERKDSLPPAPPPPEAPRGLFATYRADQGRHVRMAAFWSVVFFLVFGCRFLHDVLIQWASLREPLGGIRIPVVAVNLSPAFLVSFLVFLAGLVVIQRWQQRPKVADLLIDTEAELKKVTWPSGTDVWNASMVVIASVVLLGAFLALADIFLFRLMRYLILGIR
jgi:preprotein translocase SecE subunit